MDDLDMPSPAPPAQGDAQDPAMAATPQETSADELPVDVPDEEQPQQDVAPPEEEQSTDEYSGPTDDQLVGDSRRLHVYGLRPDYDPGESTLGEAWQDENGQLHGSGMLAVMLFEPNAKDRYVSASLARDLSPLAVLEKRLSRATLFRTELLEGDNESE